MKVIKAMLFLCCLLMAIQMYVWAKTPSSVRQLNGANFSTVVKNRYIPQCTIKDEKLLRDLHSIIHTYRLSESDKIDTISVTVPLSDKEVQIMTIEDYRSFIPSTTTKCCFIEGNVIYFFNYTNPVSVIELSEDKYILYDAKQHYTKPIVDGCIDIPIFFDSYYNTITCMNGNYNDMIYHDTIEQVDSKKAENIDRKIPCCQISDPQIRGRIKQVLALNEREINDFKSRVPKIAIVVLLSDERTCGIWVQPLSNIISYKDIIGGYIDGDMLFLLTGNVAQSYISFTDDNEFIDIDIHKAGVPSGSSIYSGWFRPLFIKALSE